MKTSPDTTLNITHLHSSSILNITADYAFCKGNIRSWNQEDLLGFYNSLGSLAEELSIGHDVKLNIRQEKASHQSPMTQNSCAISYSLSACGNQLGITLQRSSSGGLTMEIY